jgi:DNA-binding MarR family transcriptional regulator
MRDDNYYSSWMSAAERSSTTTEAGARDTDVGDTEGADEAMLALITVCLSTTIRAGAAARPSLSPTQVRTLTVIAGVPGGLSINAVAEAISASNPSASRLCQRLVRDGLLDRAAGPGNELRMSLSRHGHRTLDAVNADRIAELRALLDALPPTRRRRAVAALRDLADQS